MVASPMSKARIIALVASLFIGAAHAQIANPGVQQSGSVTSGHCTEWGPGLGQIQDAGQGCLGGTPSALTGANDTNVTLTLTGTPASALLQAVQIQAGWTGTLAAARLNSNVVQGITNDTNVTGSISAQNLALGWSGVLSIARGGTGAGTQSGAANNILPTPTRTGDVVYWNGTQWVTLAGNNSGTQVFSENASGAPAWSSAGTGTVTSVGGGYGISGGPITGSGTLAVSLSEFTNSIGSNVALSNTSTFFDGPSVAQGTSGVWDAGGTVTLLDSTAAAAFFCKLWDGTNVAASGVTNSNGASSLTTISLHGILSSPTGNIRISCKDTTSGSGVMEAAVAGGGGKDSTVKATRIQ
jgi:hypothetical protein